MANVRMAGRRALARLAVCFCLGFPIAAFAADDAAPYPEYEGDYRWSPIAAEASGWQLAANCAWEGYLGCQLQTVQVTGSGYVYKYQHHRTTPGGGIELLYGEGFGQAAWSCPPGHALYAVFMGMDVGPYPNRSIDLIDGAVVKCKPAGGGLGSLAVAGTAAIEEQFDERGRLVERHVGGGDPAAWSVAWDATSASVSGHGESWTLQATIDQGRAVSLGQMELEYDAEGALDTVRGPGGTVFARALVHDPDGSLVAALRAARHHLPDPGAPGPLATLSRLGPAIDALLDAR
ncbi:hypothetical protein KPL74_18945 [Bacillus sp. NP157]|nr:hypothetical protein KPL74_18945 [Bacillus sp. NP157]